MKGKLYRIASVVMLSLSMCATAGATTPGSDSDAVFGLMIMAIYGLAPLLAL